MKISLVVNIALQTGEKLFLKYLRNVHYQNQSGRGKKNELCDDYPVIDKTPSSRFM